MKRWMKLLFWGLLFALVFVMLFFESKKEGNAILNLPTISIQVEGVDSFLNTEEVMNRLKTHQVFEEYQHVRELDILKAERVLDTMPEVRNVQVYKSLKGRWNIDIELVRPIARIFPRGEKSYYLDADGNKMRRSSIHTARVLVFSGYIPDHIDAENTNLIINNDSLKSIRLLDDIYRISNYVCKDPVLQSLIGQVYCNESHEFILIPVLGKHKIVFGKAGTEKEVEDKFERLKVFYEEALPFEGWNKYTEISLKYEGQVVCRKVS